MLKDSIVICYKYAEAIQLNQLFGIEANGTWSFEAFDSNGVAVTLNIDDYVKTAQSGIYNGATIMNGKAIYETTVARKIVVTYTSAAGSCLAGEKYPVKIILTDN
jgi:predicted metalloprotease